jgi:hypothetical protein
VVYDRVATTAGSQVFQMVSPASPVLNGVLSTLTGAGHTLNVQRVISPASTAPTVFSFKVGDADFSAGFRLDETATAGDNRFLHVLSIDGAVTGVPTATTDGVTLVLIGGQAVTVQFNRDSIGGSITIGSQTTTLGAGVDTLPE